MDDDGSLDTLLARATNPLSRDLDLEAVQLLCDRILLDREGPIQALRFLAHKIQSPQEREAIQALLVLEECTARCGGKFQDEVGKFRFLNELIKVVSPKYLGNRASQRVKQKIIEIMYRWSIELKHHSKIQEAYHMLKRQGVIALDPVYVIDDPSPIPPVAPRSQSTVFEDEEKSQMLQKLLQSKNPEDLQAANRLIKSMVKEADRRMELLARRTTEIETVHNNAKVLKDMLNNYRPQETSSEEKELMKELFESCERLRPKLFRLAGEMEEKDEGLNEILTANDELTTVINIYKKAMGLESSVVNGSTAATAEVPNTDRATSQTVSASLLDLCSPQKTEAPTRPSPSTLLKTDLSLLDDQLLALGINDSPEEPSTLSDWGRILGSSVGQTVTHSSFTMGGISSRAATQGTAAGSGPPKYSPVHVASSVMVPISNPYRPPVTSAPATISTIGSTGLPPAKSKGLEELDALGQSLIRQALPHHPSSQGDFPGTPQRIPLNQMPKQMAQHQNQQTNGAPGAPPLLFGGPVTSTAALLDLPSAVADSPNKGPDSLVLADVFVPLESVQPGTQKPLTLHDTNGVKVIIHFTKNVPRPDVFVMVVSTMSQNASPVKNVVFQAAVPKTMRIKMQPPSATELPPHNPILPTAAITQVMLLANSTKEKVRMKYKISYVIDEVNYTGSGEVDSLLEPSPATSS
ncbi:ADP-ribosylation factor-binding protein GGA1-like [Ornithodoros turicata]|uniref:ADP-ribosylation factor-binding protein GGA1-like n=1 Tax=Ornithodoros turicata TaxID=34597 RepID=UPI0031388C15